VKRIKYHVENQARVVVTDVENEAGKERESLFQRLNLRSEQFSNFFYLELVNLMVEPLATNK